jgi:hypothetical protein
MTLRRALVPLLTGVACVLTVAPAAAAPGVQATIVHVGAADASSGDSSGDSSDAGLPPGHERALFASTYASLRDRVEDRGYAPTSLKGYYGGMYTRDASVNALALTMGGDFPQARAILRYVLAYTAASGQPTIPHRVFPMRDTPVASAQQDVADDQVATLGQGHAVTRALPGPAFVTAVDAWLSRSGATSGTLTAVLQAVQDGRPGEVRTATMPAGEVPATGGWVTFRFPPPLLGTPPVDGYTLTLSSTGPSEQVTWWGSDGAGPSFRERTHDFRLSGYDAWDEVDEKYSVLLAWARYVQANPSDRDFVTETWPWVRRYADYHLTRPGYLSDALDLIRNPILDDESYHDVYDLLTNTVTAQALHELAPVADRLGDGVAAARWTQVADRISSGISRNLVTEVDGRRVYGAWYDGRDPSRFSVGWTFVNLSPIAFSWYGMDPEIMADTLAAYRLHESRDWSGVRMLSSMSDYGFTGHNDWVLTKAVAWEWAQVHRDGDRARVEELDRFLRTYYPDVTQPISEGWILDDDGNLRITDPGNQEHASWYAVMMLATYPGLAGHPGRCALPRGEDPTAYVSLAVTPARTGTLVSGEPVDLVVTVSNGTCQSISGVTPALRVPDGWDVVAEPGDLGTVEAGAEATGTFTVVPRLADGSEPIEPASLVGTASYRMPRVSSATVTGATTVRVAGAVQPPLRTFASTEAYFGQLGSRYEIDANGRDMSASIDEYGTIYQPAGAGPQTVATVQVLSQGNTGPWAKAGIVYRTKLDARSAGYVLLAVTPGNGFALQWDGNGDGRLDGGKSTIKTGTTAYPAWLRLERAGSTYTAAYSVDGTQWLPVGSVTVPGVGAQQDVGVFASAVNAAKPGTVSDVVFDHLSIR